MHNIHLKTASVLLALYAIAAEAQSTYLPIAPSALVSSEQRIPTQSPQEAPPAVGQSYALTPNPSAAVLPNPTSIPTPSTHTPSPSRSISRNPNIRKPESHGRPRATQP